MRAGRAVTSRWGSLVAITCPSGRSWLIVVVVAAGNGGTDSHGHEAYGAVMSPGNAPWVITVGASSTMGTLTRRDDEVADFSARGPTAIDYGAKPDLVAF